MDTENSGINGRDSRGRFAIGNPGKPEGAMINASKKVKQAVWDFLDRNIDSVQESFDQLKPIEKLQFIANILPYALPKLSSVQSENNTKLSGGINIRWSEPGVHHTLNKGSNGELPGLPSGLPDNS